MKKGKTLYGILCGVGGTLIGLFANKLDTIYGGVLFAFGVFLLVFSIIKLNKFEILRYSELFTMWI